MHRQKLLPTNVLNRLASLVEAVTVAESADLSWRGNASIHFLRNFTIEPIEPYLKFHFLRQDVKATITYGGYDTMSQEILDPTSSLNQNVPDVIVLALMLENFDAGINDRNWTAERSLERFDDLFGRLLSRSSSFIILNTLIPPIELLKAGANNDPRLIEIATINKRLRILAEQHKQRVALTEWEDILGDVGVDKSIDYRFWAASQAPFKSVFLNRYANDILRFGQTPKSYSKKCLVLDCDNTLWGGVIGEDGLDGVSLHPHDYPGAYFYQFQKTLLELHDRGVMLALCSKNNEEDVWQVLSEHPHCLLDRSHLVAWRINWENKASNIVSLAAELNIGVDSVVFVDDSPQECALINNRLTDVTVLQVPENLAHYAKLLSAGDLFKKTTLSDEDRHRTRMYKDASERRQIENQFGDLTDYLQSLNTTVRIALAADSQIPRVAQLTQKTNQFNLTTRRYTEADIRDFSKDANMAVYVMVVSDRFGEMGLTGVLIARREKRAGIIDTLLLSCRVLGRQLEFAFVDQCMKTLEKKWKLTAWRAEYVPSPKNSQVSDFWSRVGFAEDRCASSGRIYTTKTCPRPVEYMKIMSILLE